MLKSHLENALKRLDDWLQSQIPAWFTGITSEPSSVMFRKLKAICEIGYLEFFVNPSPNLRLKNQIYAIIKCLVKNNVFMSLVRHNTEHSNLFIPLLAIYLSDEIKEDKERIDVVNLIKYNLLSGKERLPFREIDLMHMSYKISMEPSFLNDIYRIAKFGCAGKFKNIISFSTSDEYALTHTVFYITDFGRIMWSDDILAKDRLCLLINMLCDKAKNANDTDIFAEYVLCKQYLEYPHTEIETDLQEFLKKQNEDFGYWLGPLELETQLSKEGFEKNSLCFFQNYHTSIVVRICLCNCLYGIRKGHDSAQPLINKDSQKFEPIYIISDKNVSERLQKEFKELYEAAKSYHKFGKFKISIDFYTNPTLILLGTDLMYLFKRNECYTPENFFDVFQALMDKDILSQHFDIRFVRIWCHLNSMAGAIEEKLAESILNKYNLLLNDNEDCGVLLLLLVSKLSPKNKSEAQKRIDTFCMRSILEKDMRAINYILFYAFYENIKKFYGELVTLFLSMNSVTLPYGWLKSSDAVTSNYCDILSYITAIQLEKEKVIEIVNLE